MAEVKTFQLAAPIKGTTHVRPYEILEEIWKGRIRVSMRLGTLDGEGNFVEDDLLPSINRDITGAELVAFREQAEQTVTNGDFTKLQVKAWLDQYGWVFSTWTP